MGNDTPVIISLIFISSIANFAASVDESTHKKTSFTDMKSNYDFFLQNGVIEPSVSIGILVRNKDHSLPYFLGHLEAQDYPKERIHLHIRLDNSVDKSDLIVTEWLNNTRHFYHSVNYESPTDDGAYVDPSWTKSHYDHVIKLRQRLLDKAHTIWADFFFSLDADVILINRNTLRNLVSLASKDNLTVVAPMLNCSSSEVFSNFWGDMTTEGYYKRSENYFSIQRRHIKGVFPVAMVHTAFLLNLRHVGGRRLAYHPLPSGYTGPIDDIIIFARRAQFENVPFNIVNEEFYGYFPMPLDETELPLRHRTSVSHWREREAEYFLHLKLQAITDDKSGQGILPSPFIHTKNHLEIPIPSKLGFDQIYLINLERRRDRLEKMEYALREQGIDAKVIIATDGKKLTNEDVKKFNITQLSGYADPYHKRALKFGEIGCFLSHYHIWQDMLLHNYQRILILEDDLRFVPGFNRRLNETLSEADHYKPTWELLYIGRKRMSSDESIVPGTKYLAYPSYTYWTLAYALTQNGAKKLMAQKPLERLVAVDEFLPIMFNRHPNKHWLSQFGPRDLEAISAEPLLVEPTHYSGEPDYISDTEDSNVIPPELCAKDEYV